MSILGDAVVFLGAAVVAVPISKRLGLGSVLGYLVAGAVIGPFLLGLIDDVESILHFAEFGVVLLLFIIGLELQPARLWVMRKSVFGTGGTQVVVTAAAISAIGWGLGLAWQAALVVGLALSLSSTAFALQVLAERKEMTTHHGRAGFSVLLFQDLAAIPVLAMVPLLGGEAGPDHDGLLLASLKVVAVLAGVIVGGHFLLRHLFRLAAWTRLREVFTATALLAVVGTALLVEQVGLSMALGAFLAGVLLADSEFRHELEATIEPFKGLLLGLFFIAVGMSIDFGLVAERPLVIVGLALGLVLLKALILFGLAKATGESTYSARRLAIALSQGGEFAFVIFGLADRSNVLNPALSGLLILAVTLSMMVTPLLFLVEDTLSKRRKGDQAEDFDTPAPDENQVIIAGFGRVGQIIGRILRAKGIGFTALEANQHQVDFVRKYGNKVYYGDPSRLELLEAAKAGQAVSLVLAMDDVEASLRTAQTVRKHYPHLKIYARAHGRQHVYRLMELGVQVIQRETFLSSLELAGDLLKGLGLPDYEAEKAVCLFREHDEARLAASFGEHGDEAKMIDHAKQSMVELEELFAADAQVEEASKS